MSTEFDIELPLFVEAVFRRYHYDFRDYAPASLKRRLRTALPRFNCASLSQLQMVVWTFVVAASAPIASSDFFSCSACVFHSDGP